MWNHFSPQQIRGDLHFQPHSERLQDKEKEVLEAA